MRALTNTEVDRIKSLTNYSVSLSLIEPTATGLSKSILDATAPVRNYLKENKVHDYSFQKLGAKDHGVFVQAQLIKPNLIIPSKASLYRPSTKSGDPRIWFTNLPSYAEPNDILALVVYSGIINVINITKIDVDSLLHSQTSNPLKELITAISSDEMEVASELLNKIRKIAHGGPLMAEVSGDTAIGRTLETALGIKINSSKTPDYKGIEIKSYRNKEAGLQNRKTLFAQVPDWQLSKLKSFAEILNQFGYSRGDDFKLYCTVSTQKENSQGLSLELDPVNDWLVENSNKKDMKAFIVWRMNLLRERLLKKHNETFWVGAKSLNIQGVEHFQFTNVIHTRKPIVSQFDLLVEQGAITLDHLIKRTPDGKCTEKGPLFKVKSDALEMLFPPSLRYDLL